MSDFFQSTPIALVGMACRLPGAADLDQYWQLLKSGSSSYRELPPSRFNRELYFHPDRGVPNKSYSTIGGVIPQVPISPAALGLSRKEADSIDVAHLTICDVAAQALRHAKMDPLGMKGQNVGVYVGGTGGSSRPADLVFSTMIEETAAYLREVPEFQAAMSTSGKDLGGSVVRNVVETVRSRYAERLGNGAINMAANMAAGLISHAFHFTGPYMAIDAACASSLQAMMLAIHALQQDRIEMAVVGSASYCKSDTLVLFSQAQSVSAKDSRPFDASADGLICSEGYIALVLKTLPRALADGDPIQCVIRGLGMSTDGKGKSLWVPRKEGQIVAIRRAYEQGLDCKRLQYLEAHATSTQVGDATEMVALTEALAGNFAPGQRVPIGASKGNVGHTLETAGVAGLTKVVLAMQNAIIPPAVHIEKLNPKIDWDRIPFYVPTQAEPWNEHRDGHPRRAAVNAFGIGGLNIHVVVDEFVAAQPKSFYMSSAPNSEAARRNEPIAVIGMGTVFPGAHTLDAFWDLLVSGQTALSELPADRWTKEPGGESNGAPSGKTGNYVGGFVRDYEYDWRKKKIPPKQIANGNPLQYMLLDAAEQALVHAGYDQRPFDRTKVGVVVGTFFGGDFATQLQMGLRLPEFNSILTSILREKGVPDDQIDRVIEQYRKLLLQKMPALLDETGSFTSSTMASRITKMFDLMGGALALDAGDASSLAAVVSGVDILRSGSCDMMICAAGQRSMDRFAYSMLSQSGVLASGTPSPPFDAHVTGTVPGEGVGVVLLKRLSDARRDGDHVRAVIRGTGFCTNNGAPEQAIEMAMQRALDSAGATPDDIVAIETSGGSTATDDHELAGIARSLGTNRTRPALLGSTVTSIGHCGAGSGMTSLIKASLSFDHQQLPAGVRVTQPSHAAKEYCSTIELPQRNTALQTKNAEQPQLIGVTAGACSGQTYHLIIEHGHAAPVARQNTSTQDAGTHKNGAAMAPQMNTEQPVRRAPIIASPENQPAFRPTAQPSGFTESAAARNKPPQPSEEASTRFQPGSKPRIAWMFPGQGSQYPGMLRALVSEFPPAAHAMQRADQAMAKLGHGSFAQLAWENTGGLGVDIWQTQISMLLADYIVSESLAALGVHPDVVAGHSYGEYPAYVAAGVWPLETAIQCTRLRADSLSAGLSAQGGMVAVSVSREVAHQLIQQAGGLIYAANYNTPQQTVLAGERQAIAKVADLAKQSGYSAITLAVPCAFHTPLMSAAARMFSERLPAIAIHSARLPVVSTASARYICDTADIRQSLCDQLTHPVPYVEMVQKIAAEGPTVFVEVGPQQVLTKFHQNILGTQQSVRVVSADQPKQPGLQQLLSVVELLKNCGALESSGEVSTFQVRREAAPQAEPKTSGHFDATERRRQSKRKESLQEQPDSSLPKPKSSNGSHSAAPQLVKAKLNGANGTSSTGHMHRESAPAASLGTYERSSGRALETATGQQKQLAVLDNLESDSSTALEGLKEFLIAFVVEQTGYPPEVVDLEADLEADLGIDSIKKAQLFGELGEHFKIAAPTGNVTLDQFPTLRHVYDFIAQDLVAQSSTQGLASSPATLPLAAPTELNSNLVAPVDVPSHGYRYPGQSNATNGTHAATHENGKVTGNLETFVIDFIVEQTGYPPEAVDLDADLEADLGIDSIKKAQLFGEIGERFQIAAPTGQVTLDDFPTLRHVMNYIAESTSGAITLPSQDNSLPVSSMPVAREPVVQQPRSAEPEPFTTPSGVEAGELQEFLVNFIVEQTGYPPEHVDLDADLEADLGIDSIKKAQMFGEIGELFKIPAPTGNVTLDDFPTVRHVLNYMVQSLGVVSPPAHAPVTNNAAREEVPAAVGQSVSHSTQSSWMSSAATVPASTDDIKELESFLIDFIVEQTGYPPEHVDLDADLEADLGIDSIKKAQLFGELGERFQVGPPTGQVTLDDFPTLRHVLDFLLAGASTVTDKTALEPTPPAEPAKQSREQTSPESVRLMNRFVVRLVSQPLPAASVEMTWGSRALVLGENPDSRALVLHLRKKGLDVQVIAGGTDPLAGAAEVERAWQAGPIEHLFVLTARDGVDASYRNELAWNQRRQAGLLMPFAICQKWFEKAFANKGSVQPTLVAVTALGGDFGQRGEFVALEGGGISGLLKAVVVETNGQVKVKVFDMPTDYRPDHLASDVIAELESGDSDVEVSYNHGRQRSIVRARRQPASALPPRSIPHGSTWVITGGARGITAYVARELGERFGLRLHLLGSSPAPQIDPAWRNLSPDGLRQLKAQQIAAQTGRQGVSPAEAWARVERSLEIDRNLRDLAARGIQATYHVCDISDRKQLTQVIAKIRAADGSICGVIHGAGVESASKFPKKKLDLVAKAIAVKVDGAAGIASLLSDDPPEFFVGFGSTSGRFGGLGQTDYSLANDLLTKFISRYRHEHPQCTAVAIDWSSWGEIGMSARPESKFALQGLNVRFMPPAEGLDHLLDELQAQGHDSEVVIVDHPGCVSSHMVMSDVDGPLEQEPTGTSNHAKATTARKHQFETADASSTTGDEIQAYLKLLADSHGLENPQVANPPAAMNCVYNASTMAELRDIADRSGVALASLLAHNRRNLEQPALRVQNDASRPISNQSAATGTGPVDTAAFPMLASALLTSTGRTLTAKVVVDPKEDVFLRDHRLYRRPYFPAVVSTEILAEAANCLLPGQSLVEIRDLDLLSGHTFVSDAQVPLEAQITQEGASSCRCELILDSGNGSPTRMVTMTATFSKQSPAREEFKIAEPHFGWIPFQYPDDWSIFYHGPTFRTFREFAFQHNGGRANMLARPPREMAGHRPGANWLIPSALLDGSMMACGSYSFFMLDRQVVIPRRIERLAIYRQPPAGTPCKLLFSVRKTSSSATHYDFQLATNEGDLILTADNFEMICIKDDSKK